jgi:excisionase family DNA binding protein
MQENLLSPQEVADWLHVSVDLVQAHATRKEPRLGCFKVGKLLRFKKTAVEQFIEDAEVKGSIQ